MKRKITIIVLGIFIVVLSMVGQTYAMWSLTKTQEKQNEIETACIDLSFSDEGSESINLSNAFPMKEEAGRRLTPYTFTVKNNCSQAVDYRVDLDSLKIESGKYIPTNLIDIIFDGGDLLKYSEMPVANTDDTDSKEKRVLKYDTLPANSSKTHTIILFLDSNASNNSGTANYIDSNAGFVGKLNVKYGQIVDTQTSIISGNINTIGSEVAIGTEHFYVLGDDYDSEGNPNGNVRLFAKYNLNVGTNLIETGLDGEPITEEECTDTYHGTYDSSWNQCSWDVSQTESDYNMQKVTSVGSYCEDYEANGDVPNIIYDSIDKFSKEELLNNHVYGFNCVDSFGYNSAVKFINDAEIDRDSLVETYNSDDYQEKRYSNLNMSNSYETKYIYDENSDLYPYLENYKSILTNKYNIRIDDVYLISREELETLGCLYTDDLSAEQYGSCITRTSVNNNRYWLFNTSYWTGSMVFYLGVAGELRESLGYFEEDNNFDFTVPAGVRPVLSVPKSQF